MKLPVFVWRRRWPAGGVRLEASYTAEFDAEDKGVLSAQLTHFHTGGASEHSITHTIEHITY